MFKRIGNKIGNWFQNSFKYTKEPCLGKRNEHALTEMDVNRCTLIRYNNFKINQNKSKSHILLNGKTIRIL